MKDRIRKIMESQHMSQQTFAHFIQTSPASLSSIFNGRTKPTLNIVEAIKSKLPSISTDWLMFGTGQMYTDDNPDAQISDNQTAGMTEGSLDFSSQLPPSSTQQSGQISLKTPNEQMLKNVYKIERNITEIRIFYSDQTWETFVPKVHK